MKVIKKSNNNVAEYENSKGRRSIAFGNGIGFKAVPYELTDLSNINMTFYKLENHYERLIMEIPEEILSVSSDIVMYAQKKLQGQLDATLVFGLGDHIHFAFQKYAERLDIHCYSSVIVNFIQKN